MENNRNPKPSDENNENVNDLVESSAGDELTDDGLIDELETACVASTVADKPPMDKNLFF